MDYNRVFDSSKTGRKGVSPGVRFSLRRLQVGEVFPWYTCMPTLGARPHSACGVRRAQVPVMSTTTSRLRRHIFAFFCDMRNFSRWQPLCPPLRHGEGVRGRVFAAVSCRGQRHAGVVTSEARKSSYSPLYLWCQRLQSTQTAMAATITACRKSNGRSMSASVWFAPHTQPSQATQSKQAKQAKQAKQTSCLLCLLCFLVSAGKASKASKASKAKTPLCFACFALPYRVSASQGLVSTTPLE